MIALKNFSYTYKNGGGVRGINLDIAPGELVVLTGQSGCGKTTLTRLINGLAFHYYEGAYEGECLVNGGNPADLPLWETGRLVGSVFQDPREGFFAKYAEGEIAYACENYGFPRDEIRRRVEGAIAALGIESLRRGELQRFSSGEKQKTAIASVYAPGPRVYVFDEPSANLDTAATLALGGILRTLKEQGCTVVVAEHRINYLTGLADRFVYLKAGEIRRIFSRREFLEADRETLSALGLRDREFRALEIRPREGGGVEGGHTLEVESLCGGYRKKRVFENFSVLLRPGDIMAITGANGAGKTTLCRVLCGLQNPAAGEIRWDGERTSPAERRAISYYVSNSPDTQLFAVSVREEPLLGLKNSPENRERAEGLLGAFGLSEYADRHPLGLSGGQKQRLTLAAAMMRNRGIIVLDEPTSGLDLINMELTAKAVAAAAEQGAIIIAVSHDREFINRVCNRHAAL